MDTKTNLYHIVTYGCQMNLHESEKLAGILASEGYTKTDSIENANIIIFNTCCIRENAEERVFGNVGALKKLKASKKDLIIAVGGCMTQQAGEAEIFLKKFPFVDIIFGTHNLEKFSLLLKQKLQSKKSLIAIEDGSLDIIEGTPKLRTSFPNAWVNIIYGCNNFCTYCIVPYVRGREKSRKEEDILAEVRKLVASGYKEITLLGQNVNSYGGNTETSNFPKLLENVAKIDGNFRLRFMTNHPKDLSEDLIKVMAKYDKICNNIHLPVQSGSNRILKLMNRHYNREDYLSKVEMLKKYIPDVAISTDIMVGFPTETEEDFNDTLDLVKKCNFSGAFTFIYSKRHGTPAEKMDGQIDEEISKNRIYKLIETQNEINKLQSKAYQDKIIEILCEGYDDKKKMYLGRDVYGRMGYFNSTTNVIGEFVKIIVKDTGGISLIGERV